MTDTFRDVTGFGSVDNFRMGLGRLDICNEGSSKLLPLGLLEGSATATFDRAKHDIKAGTPQVTLEQYAIEEFTTLKVTMVEFAMANIVKQLSYPDSCLSVVPAAVSAPVTETVTFGVGSTPNTQTLEHCPVHSDGVITVTSTGTTPVSYADPGDFSVDKTDGTITRNSLGSIGANDAVLITYQYDTPAVEQITFGGIIPVRKYHVKFYAANAINDVYYVIEFYRAVINSNLSLSFSATEHGKNDVEFKGLADPDRAMGDTISRIYKSTTPPWLNR